MGPAPLPLIDANGLNALKVAVFEAIVDHRLDRSEDRMPAGTEGIGGFLPGKAAGPLRQEQLVSPTQGTFSFGPGNPFDLDSTLRTIHTPQTIAQVTLESPDRNELVETGIGRGIVSGSLLSTSRTHRFGSTAWMDLRDDALAVLDPAENHSTVNKTLEPMAGIEQRLHLHRRSFRFVFLFTPTTQRTSVHLSTPKRKNYFFRRKENTFTLAIGRSGTQAGSRIKCPACGAEAAKAAEFMPGSCLRAA